ncbi:MAG: hypothetical protein WC512_00115 [Candidatus Omnitrophota bacterium]
MPTDEKFIDLISKARKAPVMSKGFWAKFDAELGAKLNAAEKKRISLPLAVFEAVEDMAAVLRNVEFKRALATASVAVTVIGFSIIFSMRGGPGLYSVSSLTNDELIDEIVILGTCGSGENMIDF